ncbi:unnamed protein product, partial [Effrenium voratum]
MVLHRRTLFGGQAVLHAGEGAVTALRWRTTLIAWANDRGVKVYNTATSQKVTYVARPSTLPGRIKACLLWLADDQLAMAWGNFVKIAVILPDSAGCYAEVRHQFNSVEAIHGLASLGPEQLAALESDNCRAATLRLYSSSGDLFHGAEVPLGRGAFHSHLHLAASAPHLPMCVTAPRDFLAFQVRDLLEYAVQLLEERNFEEAIRLANGGGEGIQGLGHIVCLKRL